MNRRQGSVAEDEAAAFITQKGWKVLHRNWAVRQGELDLVAMDGETLVFIEVKSRGSGAFGGAVSSVSTRKRKKLVMAALRYLAEEAPPEVPARFDVLYRQGAHGEWTLLQDAFRPEEAL